MGHGWGIGGWVLDVAVMAAVWGLALWALVSLARGPSEDDRAPAAELVLDERFARGEIAVDEYEQRREALHLR